MLTLSFSLKEEQGKKIHILRAFGGSGASGPGPGAGRLGLKWSDLFD